MNCPAVSNLKKKKQLKSSIYIKIIDKIMMYMNSLS